MMDEDDPLAAARGIANGCFYSMVLWLLFGASVWILL